MDKLTLDKLNAMSAPEAMETLRRCCGSSAWCEAMAKARPFKTMVQLREACEQHFDMLMERDWREAFAAHPKIGDLKSLRMKYAGNKEWAGGEQAGVSEADEEVLRRLAAGNTAYEGRFGYIFIVCATGKSAGQMMEMLEERMGNTPQKELRVAAGEQKKITRLRLDKLLA